MTGGRRASRPGEFFSGLDFGERPGTKRSSCSTACVFDNTRPKTSGRIPIHPGLHRPATPRPDIPYRTRWACHNLLYSSRICALDWVTCIPEHLLSICPIESPRRRGNYGGAFHRSRRKTRTGHLKNVRPCRMSLFSLFSPGFTPWTQLMPRFRRVKTIPPAGISSVTESQRNPGAG